MTRSRKRPYSPRMIGKGLAFALVGSLAVALAAPSSASTTPSKVGLVSFTTASTTSLTLTWPKTRNATSYQVFRSTHQNMSGAKLVGARKAPRFTATKLTPGKIYCFQVRAKRGKTYGKRSSHTCKPAIRSQGSGGPTYRVMTYNVCSSKCSGWRSRQAGAQSLIQAQKPAVVALQEAEGNKYGSVVSVPAGYTRAEYKSAKMLFYRTDRFTQDDGGYVTMGPGRYAVWAELVDKASGQHVIFVDVHTTTGKSDASAYKRQAEITELRNRMDENNPERLPVVYAGDFNSHRNRPNDYLAGVFHSGGYAGGTRYYDAYDLARSLNKPNHNSYNGFQPTPIRSYTWGDHVDHVWVDPKTTRILRWALVARFSGSNYAAPIPSDHNALSIDVQVNR